MLVDVLTTNRFIHADGSEARVDWRDRSLSRCTRVARLLEVSSSSNFRPAARARARTSRPGAHAVSPPL